MEKYFGEYAEGYYWLFANEKMLHETGLIGANFKGRVEQSFSRFSDNFLRISAGDAGPTDFTKSDAFFLRDKIIPSSYMYCLLLKTSMKKKIKTDFLYSQKLNRTNTQKWKIIQRQKRKRMEIIKRVKRKRRMKNIILSPH